MGIAAKIDDFGQVAWITIMVLAFIAFWPAGLAILAFLIWSGRLGCWARGGHSNMYKARGRWHGPWRSRRNGRPGANSAFDEYREETLRRLEEEQEEFDAFLDRLRKARDKSEFDQFMAERRGRADGNAGEAAA